MDRLVKADVKEVEIRFIPNEKCVGVFRLTNLMHAMSVAVSLKSSNSQLITFPNTTNNDNNYFTIIPPLSSTPCTFFLNPSEIPPLRSSKPLTITVRSVMLPTGKATPDDLRRVFSPASSADKSRHVFVDCVIPVSLVGPAVAIYLITTAKTVSGHHERFLVGALSGCTTAEAQGLFEVAVRGGNVDAVSAIIAAGTIKIGRGFEGRSIVSVAAEAGNLEIVEILVAAGAKVDEVDLEDGRTPVHAAAAYGYVEVLGFLLSVGADSNARDKRGRTALHHAAAEGQLAAAELLLEFGGACKYVVDNEGKMAFGSAAENGHSELMPLLRLDDALRRATRVGDVGGVRGCLSGGAALDGKDQWGWTPLHRAALKGRIECARELLARGVNVDVGDQMGYTPLRCAVEAGHRGVVELLVEYGARFKHV